MTPPRLCSLCQSEMRDEPATFVACRECVYGRNAESFAIRLKRREAINAVPVPVLGDHPGELVGGKVWRETT